MVLACLHRCCPTPDLQVETLKTVLPAQDVGENGHMDVDEEGHEDVQSGK